MKTMNAQQKVSLALFTISLVGLALNLYAWAFTLHGEFVSLNIKLCSVCCITFLVTTVVTGRCSQVVQLLAMISGAVLCLAFPSSRLNGIVILGLVAILFDLYLLFSRHWKVRTALYLLFVFTACFLLTQESILDKFYSATVGTSTVLFIVLINRIIFKKKLEEASLESDKRMDLLFDSMALMFRKSRDDLEK